MLPVGMLIALGGYTLLYFGVASIQGEGVGMLDLIVPGRYKGHHSSKPTTHLTKGTDGLLYNDRGQVVT